MTEKQFILEAKSKNWSAWAIQKTVEIDRKRKAFDPEKKQ